MGMPSPYKQVDLLQTCRRQFRFPSNKLDYVARVLGLGSKTKHQGMALWHGCMDGDPKCWKKMEQYNKQDVLLLEKVYKELLPWIPNHPNHGLYGNGKKMVCRNCGSGYLESRGYETTAVGKYQRLHCKKCGHWNRNYLNVMAKEHKQNVLR
jgi:RNase P subunit RPR2